MHVSSSLSSKIVAVLILVAFSAAAEIQIIPSRLVPQARLKLRTYHFEDLPPDVGSCRPPHDASDPRIENPHVYDRLIIRDPHCLETAFCSYPTCERCDGAHGNIAIFLTRGGTLEFPTHPRVVILDTQGNGDNPFRIRATDAEGQTLDVDEQGILYGTVLIGLQSTAGISRVEVVNVGGSGGPLAFASVSLEAPPWPASELRAEARTANHVELFWKDNSENEESFVIEFKIGADGTWEEWEPGPAGPGATSAWLSGLHNGTTYFFRIKASNSIGDSDYSNEAEVTTPSAVTEIVFRAVPSQDGFISELSEFANTGGHTYPAGAGLGALRAGDTVNDQQYKTLLCFNTEYVPKSATVVSAKLSLKQASIVGTDPFTTHGPCYVDIHARSGFGTSPALQSADFQARAQVRRVAELRHVIGGGDWYEAPLEPACLRLVNQSGVVQLRVYFAIGDNDDGNADYIGWCSGESPNELYRPALTVVFWEYPQPVK